MKSERRFRRFKLDVATLDGKMLLVRSAEVFDISDGGASIRSREDLPFGKELLITFFDEKGEKTGIKGLVVGSRRSEAGDGAGEAIAAFYTAHIRFLDGQAEKIAYLLGSLEEHRVDGQSPADDRRRHVRFHMTIPLDSVLSHTAKFRVKEMSKGGMLIQSEQPLGINSLIPMDLSIAGGRVNFTGRVAYCRTTEANGTRWHDIGVEFLDLTDKGKSLLTRFLDSLAVANDNSEGEQRKDKSS